MKLIKKLISLPIICNIIFAHGISESDKSQIVQGDLLDYLILGAKHMVTGYDHILFLIGVIFFLTKFYDIIKFITVFTIGHSLTLIFATLFQINANYHLIDAVIAFSVIYKGFENLDGFKKWFSIKSPNIIWMIFIFGLIHGFGLSTRLQEISLGEHNLIRSILSFNIGVELGQITALAIVFPILSIARKSFFNKISVIINWGLIIIGTFLLIFQLNNFFSEFNINHQHDHGNKNKYNELSVSSDDSIAVKNKLHNEHESENHKHSDHDHN